MFRKKLRHSYDMTGYTDLPSVLFNTFLVALVALFFGLAFTDIYPAPQAVLLGIAVYSVLYCLLVAPHGYYLVDLPKSLGWHRVWLMALMLPMWPLLVISWLKMRRTVRLNEQDDSDTEVDVWRYASALESLERPIQQKALDRLAEISQRQANISYMEMNAELAHKIVDRIRNFSYVRRVTEDVTCVHVTMFAEYVHYGKTYCLGGYSLDIYDGGTRSFGLTHSLDFARASERRREDNERLDKMVLKNFEKNREALLRWWYTGRIDKLVQTASLLIDNAVWECHDLNTLEERYMLTQFKTDGKDEE